MYLLKKKIYKKLTKSEETFLTCTFMVPVGSSVMLELVLAVHSYHMIAYLVLGQLRCALFSSTK